jgi:hypothetical protein
MQRHGWAQPAATTAAKICPRAELEHWREETRAEWSSDEYRLIVKFSFLFLPVAQISVSFALLWMEEELVDALEDQPTADALAPFQLLSVSKSTL